jgi:hypothetical protein
MDYEVKKTPHCVSLENGNTIYLLISFKPSVNHLDRIQDIGIVIQVNKREFHSSLMPKINQLIVEANSELKLLNSRFKGCDVSEFDARFVLPNEAQ